MPLQLYKLLETIITANSMFASNTVGGSIVILLSGTNIALPNNQNLNSFTVNGANDTYTVPVTGRYFITYQINSTSSLLANTRLVLNGTTPIPGTIITPSVTTSSYSNNVIVSLTAGNTITLQVYGLIGSISLQGGGSTGASLSIIRLT